MRQRHLDRAAFDGVEIVYEVRGAGEPVVLVHAGIFADWNRPLVEELSLSNRYCVVSYHRVGCAGSSTLAGPISIADQAAHCRALMRYLDIERAHVVGHSDGGMIALQLALDAPEAVQTLVLLESARPAIPTEPEEMAFARSVAQTALQRYSAGDKTGALDVWLRGVGGPDYRALLDQLFPAGAFEQYVADADTFFSQELPAVRQWSFTPEDARRVTQPALAVLGARSKEVTRVFDLRHELLLGWLPSAEAYILPDATHLLHLQNPHGLAEGLTAFFARHPIKVLA